MLKFVINQNPLGQYSWTCYTKDGTTLARSCRGYEVKIECMEAVDQVIEMLPEGTEVTVEEEPNTSPVLAV